MKKNSIDTKCVQSGYNPESGDPRVLPLYQSTTYKYDTAQELADLFDLKIPGHIYSRISNPTVACFEAKIADLEGGVSAVAFSSGVAAEATCIMNVCNTGDNILSAKEIYGGTYNLFDITLRKYGINTRFFDQYASDEEIEKLIDENTKMIFLETVANPGMSVLDFEKFSRIAKKHKILFVVDNTLATPVLVRPLEHGVNIVIHSSTKYLDGHASCVGGLVVDGGNFDFNNNPRYKEFYTPDKSYHGMNYVKDCGNLAFGIKLRVQLVRDFGNPMSPFSAYLTNMGTETLHLRMERHSKNALAVAEKLSESKLVNWVKYPGLKSSNTHELAKKYFENGMYSGMLAVSFKLTKEQVFKFMENLKIFKIVTHIADVRSCVLHPATTTHRQLSKESQKTAGIDDTVVRFSVGIEDTQDIVNDVIQALNSI